MKIIAHRGASAECPENTVAAFERALEIGVDAVELDLLITKEERLVVRHDDLIRQKGSWHSIRELSFDELKEVDVGKGERIPSLEEVFDRFYGRSPLMLDLKTFGLAESLSEFLIRRKALQGVHITSFLHSEIVEIAKRIPGIERSIVVAAMPIDFEPLFRDSGTQEVSLFRGYLNETITKRLQDHGIRVRAYPVNWPEEAKRFASWGVDAIFTDDPARMQSFRKL